MSIFCSLNCLLAQICGILGVEKSAMLPRLVIDDAGWWRAQNVHKQTQAISVDNPPPARPILNQLIQAAHGLAHRLWRLVLAHHMQQRLHQATLHRAVHDVGAPCEQRGQEPAHVCHTHAVLTFVQEVEVQVQVLQLLLHLLQQHRPARRAFCNHAQCARCVQQRAVAVNKLSMQRGACSHARGLASDNGLTVLFRQTDAAENACSARLINRCGFTRFKNGDAHVDSVVADQVCNTALAERVVPQ
mmetsp:Transcript_17276/g.51917  ORF Transcript_17276/g.51917 Transcript_17276/m.51917 type:complete len:245 (-) Transcript_17276:280-1014(-)